MRRVAAFGIGLVLFAVTSHAADVPVAGTRAQIRVHGDRAKLTFSSSDPGWTLPAPDAGTPGPIQIDVSSPAHPARVTVNVQAVAGQPGWTLSTDRQGVPRRYRFKNPAAPNGFSAIDSIVWSAKGSFKIVVRDALLDATTAQRGFSIRVTDPANRHCARFDGGMIVKDVPGAFDARHALASALADCSPGSLGESDGDSCAMAPDGSSCGGTCSGDAQCTFFGGSFTCVCAGGSNLPCGNTNPICNGFCPAGMHCGGLDPGNVVFGRECGCVPDGSTACGEAGSPTCGGACADPTDVCRPTSRKISVAPPAIGCECNPVGGCTVGNGAPGDFDVCGPGADCPPGTICESQIAQPGCFARCIGP